MDEILIIFKSSLEQPHDDGLMLFIEAVKSHFNEILDSIREGDEPDGMLITTALFNLLDAVKKDGFRMVMSQPTIGETATQGKSLIWKVKLYPTPSWELHEQAEMFQRADELDPKGGDR